jgi:hypothetical protein
MTAVFGGVDMWKDFSEANLRTLKAYLKNKQHSDHPARVAKDVYIEQISCVENELKRHEQNSIRG